MGMTGSRQKGVIPVSGHNGVRQGCSLSPAWLAIYRYRYNGDRSEEALAIAVQPGLTVSTLNCLVVV